MGSKSVDSEIQREYYAKTAARYDSMHVHVGDEHFFAMHLLLGYIELLKIRSVLDVGSGTGRALHFLKEHRPDLRVVGVEPVSELRDQARAKGLTEHEILPGKAEILDFPSESFDLVCEFGVFHHIRNPARAVEEMLRVAKKGVFLSDSNNFGQGSYFTRWMKDWLRKLGMWSFANWILTKGKGYRISEGDGLSYSYSVFNNYEQIKRRCRTIHLTNTRPSGPNLLRSTPHVVLLGIKDLPEENTGEDQLPPPLPTSPLGTETGDVEK